ncbi:hypothetical protein P3T27_002281 [Kitasatospora sp. MAA19]|uniref:hypothetical protein n=1 Tax=Kitasatospora sp. MAA19 TaxID=3035090 RepID=UPI002475F96D|nr:hypothetical protein [Kitasatospora sp. MAA19]MDH6705571.1 hypothetical protein [Kitasatospora sp. MAA19]
MGDTVSELCDFLHGLPEGEREFVLGALGMMRAPGAPAHHREARQGGQRTPLPAARSAPGIESSIEWV